MLEQADTPHSQTLLDSSISSILKLNVMYVLRQLKIFSESVQNDQWWGFSIQLNRFYIQPWPEHEGFLTKSCCFRWPNTKRSTMRGFTAVLIIYTQLLYDCMNLLTLIVQWVHLCASNQVYVSSCWWSNTAYMHCVHLCMCVCACVCMSTCPHILDHCVSEPVGECLKAKRPLESTHSIPSSLAVTLL